VTVGTCKASMGAWCHDTVYSTTCGRINFLPNPSASLLASLLPSLLRLEEKEGEKQGWGAFPSTFFLFDHMWSNKRCHDTCPQHAPVPLRAGVNRVDRGSVRPGLPPFLERALEEVQVDFAERCSAHTISTGSSWDECRAAARVLRPGAMPLRKRTGLFSSFFLLE
jgi:hypothetical protein